MPRISQTPIEIEGHTKSLAKWCEAYNVPYTRAATRYRRGVRGEALFAGGPAPMRSDGKQTGYTGTSNNPNAFVVSDRIAERVRALANEKEMTPHEVVETVLDNFFKKWDQGT